MDNEHSPKDSTMATTPMTPAAPASTGMDPEDAQDGGADDAQEQAGGGGYTIEIRVGADKSISVCVESGQEETSEEGGAPDDDSDSKPVPDIKSALTVALAIYKADGQMPAEQGDDDFNAGYATRKTF